jgi:photosystem II stability/assembly factor-like uncharacterized protein
MHGARNRFARPANSGLFWRGLARVALIVLAAGALPAAETPAPHSLLLDGTRAGSSVIAVGERGTILRSSDSARTWQAAASPALATLTGVSFSPDGVRGWAVGHDALILATSDGGQTWTKQYQGENLQDSFLDVLAIDPQRVFAVGAYGLFAATADGGRSWVRRKIIEDDYHLNRISRGPAGTLYLAGEHGTLLRSADGEKWTPIPSPYDGSFYGILPLDARTLLAHGLRGRVYRSTDDGATWQPVATPEPVLIAAAVRLKSTLVVLAGNSRRFFLSHDQGQSIVAAPASLDGAVAELVELPDGAILALGEAGAMVIDAPK